MTHDAFAVACVADDPEPKNDLRHQGISFDTTKCMKVNLHFHVTLVLCVHHMLHWFFWWLGMD